MKTEIHNPYSVKWELYKKLILASMIGMILGDSINIQSLTVWMDMLKNISFGCFSSSIVALLIEIQSVKDKNQKANSIYSSVYGGLQINISSYIACWSRLCEIGFKDGNYKNEKHTWLEWYEHTKLNYKACDEKRQSELMTFFKDQIRMICDDAGESIQRIQSQYYMLELNDVLTNNMKRIIEDFQFEFMATRLSLDTDKTSEAMWKTFDAVNKDFEKYISNWVDIKHYNHVSFKPSLYLDDKEELTKAILKSEAEEAVDKRSNKM